MGRPASRIEKNFAPQHPAPRDWKLETLKESSEPTGLPPASTRIANVPKGVLPTIDEAKLARIFVRQIETAEKLACKGGCAVGNFFNQKFIRIKFKEAFIESITKQGKYKGRQNLRLASYCPNLVDLVYGFRILVEKGIVVDGTHFTFPELKGRPRIFHRMIELQCGKLRRFDAFNNL